MGHSHLATFLVVGLGIVFFVATVRARLFGRVRHGFFLALMVAVTGAGLATASLQGLWGYIQGERILFEELVKKMETLGNVVEAEIKDDLAEVTASLERLARQTTPAAVRANPAGVRHTLATIQAFDPRVLQMSILDAQGSVVLDVASGPVGEPSSRVGTAFGLEGKVYVSEAYFSPTFTRYVLALGVPVPGADGVPVGAVTARYDIQGDFAQLLAPARFGKTGYVVLVDQQGRILAHPRDPARVGEDISRYPAVQGALQGRPGWVRSRNAAGAERLFVYRSIENPASTGRRPWILLTEVDPAEALAPIDALRTHFVLGLLVLVVICVLVASQVSLHPEPAGQARAFRQAGAGRRPHPARGHSRP
jgi:Cache domain